MGKEKLFTAGGIWTARPVAEQPSVNLVRWRVFETRLGARHFVGYSLDTHEGRVSSKIENFDPATGKGTTRSGRIYHLVGRCGHDQDAEYVWRLWTSTNSVTKEKDISLEITLQMQVANTFGAATR